MTNKIVLSQKFCLCPRKKIYRGHRQSQQPITAYKPALCLAKKKIPKSDKCKKSYNQKSHFFFIKKKTYGASFAPRGKG